MSFETDHLYSTGLAFPKNGWIASILSKFHKWYEKRARKQDLKGLLSCSEHMLNDMGLPRSEIVGELGYDPRELQHLQAAWGHPNPYSGNGSVINSNHTKRR